MTPLMEVLNRKVYFRKVSAQKIIDDKVKKSFYVNGRIAAVSLGGALVKFIFILRGLL